MSDQGKTYAAFIEGELKTERERRSAYDARGQVIVTSSGALVTLLGRLAALVKSSTVATFPAPVVIAVGVALALFVGAAACGIVAGWNKYYAAATASTLARMIGEHWTDDEVDARNNVAAVQVRTVDTLRRANAFKARWVGIGLIVQVSALVASGVAAGFVIANL
ncbi:hypothetical protein [Nocardia sp. NPDC060259]|uniref:hypothetical protein n=1 Tax=Nocardia sp. NPDC060259 TaxID=3347088 RepID=UPI0036490EC2